MDQAREASRQLADPAVSELDKGDFLVALKIKGESGEELGYFARSFLELSIRPTFGWETNHPSILLGLAAIVSN